METAGVRAFATAGHSLVQRSCGGCEAGQPCAECAEEIRRAPLADASSVRTRARDGLSPMHTADLRAQAEAVRNGGRSMEPPTRTFMEARFGADFREVRLHTDARAASAAAAIGARAYTIGRDIAFGAHEYQPGRTEGQRLLAHELTHVVQQRATPAAGSIQRADLASPRLRGNPLFEDVLDNTAVIEFGDKGAEVRRIQQLLIDLGFDLSSFGADGDFGVETRNAVKEFQRAHPPLNDDGRVGFQTMAALDAAFPAFTLPSTKSDPWTMPCVLQILCPWNKHLVESVLPTFSIVTFDSREFPVERWDGASWTTDTFTSGGFRSGTSMGFLNTTTCEGFALTVYHEGWHGQQPGSLTGVIDVERDAYINTEQWSISMGIPGQNFVSDATGVVTDLRTTSSAGETVVDEPAAEALVRQEYGGVSSAPGERILGRTGGTSDPQVRVRRPDGSEYLRNAVSGESFRAGPPVMTNLNPIDPANWTCP
jgi:hypothetical protein